MPHYKRSKFQPLRYQGKLRKKLQKLSQQGKNV